MVSVSAQVAELQKGDTPGGSVTQELEFLAGSPGSSLLDTVSKPQRFLDALTSSLNLNDPRQAEALNVTSKSLTRLNVTGAELTAVAVREFVEAAALNGLDLSTTQQAAMRTFIYLRSQGGRTQISENEIKAAEKTIHKLTVGTYDVVAANQFDLANYEMLSSRVSAGISHSEGKVAANSYIDGRSGQKNRDHGRISNPDVHGSGVSSVVAGSNNSRLFRLNPINPESTTVALSTSFLAVVKATQGQRPHSTVYRDSVVSQSEAEKWIKFLEDNSNSLALSE